MDSPRGTHGRKPASIVERFVPRPIKNHPIVFTGLVAGMFGFAASVVTATLVAEPRPYLGLCLPIAFGFISIPLTFTFAHSRFVQWARTSSAFIVEHGTEERSAVEDKKIQQWVIDQLSFFRGSKGACVTGIFLAVWTLLAFYVGDYFSPFDAWQTAFVCG